MKHNAFFLATGGFIQIFYIGIYQNVNWNKQFEIRNLLTVTS